ncbi:MAG TPA: hypothetical protein VKZ53_06890 [Candidatus Angelobacter sp.]|nr:hypothetical protein [Candidatus Angelobacter sp.]
MDFITAERICLSCVRSVGKVVGKIGGQDPISKFGIEDTSAIEDLVNRIVTDQDMGVPSAKHKVDPNRLRVSSTTTFAQLEQMIVENSLPA